VDKVHYTQKRESHPPKKDFGVQNQQEPMRRHRLMHIWCLYSPWRIIGSPAWLGAMTSYIWEAPRKELQAFEGFISQGLHKRLACQQDVGSHRTSS
jgi:hypothetical protein